MPTGRGARRSLGRAARVRYLLPLVALVLCVVGSKLALIDSSAGETPYWDQWDSEADRLYGPFLAGRLAATDLFAAHNEHWIAVPRLLALLLFVVNGLWDPRLQMVVNAGLHASSAVLIAAALPSTLGHIRRTVFVGFLAILFGAAHGWENTLAGFQSAFYFLLLFSLMFLVAISRPGGMRPGAWPFLTFAALAATLSLASGFVAPAAGAALVAFIALLRRRLEGALIATFAFLAVSTVLGLVSLMNVPYYPQLRAAGWGDFSVAFARNVAWPFVNRPYLALPLQWPWLTLAWIQLRRGSGDSAVFRLAIGLGLWALLQAAVLAWGWGHGGVGPLSRYSDLLAIGVVANGLAVSLLRPRGYRCLYRMLLCLWLAFVVAGVTLLDYRARENPDQIPGRRLTGRLQESYVSRYVASGNPAYLSDKPYGHIPYPMAARLRTLLDRPDIRATLPTAIREPLACASLASEGFTPLPVDASDDVFGVVAHQPGFRSAVGREGRMTLRCPAPERTGRLAIRLAFPEGYGPGLRVDLIDSLGVRRNLAEGASTPTKTVVFRPPREGFMLEVVNDDAQRSLAFAVPKEVGPLTLAVERLLPTGGVLAICGAGLLLVVPGLVLFRWGRLRARRS